MCNCQYFEYNGMVCQHLVHVKKYYGAQSDITHHNISVRWWKAYLYFFMKNEQEYSSTEREIRSELEKIRRDDCKGPIFVENVDDNTVPPFRRVYQFGKNSNTDFKNATKICLTSLLKKGK